MTAAVGSRNILLIDDQPAGIAWLKEFLEFKGHRVTMEASFASALALVKKRPAEFDLITVDLMMPLANVPMEIFKGKPAEYSHFPGLLLAQAARNSGYGARSVLIYSVHDTKEISAAAESLGVAFAVKNRPRDLKVRIEETLAKLAVKAAESKPGGASPKSQAKPASSNSSTPKNVARPTARKGVTRTSRTGRN